MEPGDFLRGFPAFAGALSWREEKGGVWLAHPEGGVRFLVEPLPPRRLGSLTLPRTRVTIHFHGLQEPSAAALLARFDQVYQRGGG